MKRLIITIITILCVLLLLTSCSGKKEAAEEINNDPVISSEETETEPEDEQEDEHEPEVLTLDPVSSSITADGRWLTVINETYANPAGSNSCPALSFNEVTGAGCYAVYMVDVSASNWIHWIAQNITVTDIEEGAVLDGSTYIGPYPPSGVHTYEIHIYALKAAPDNYPGSVNGTISSIDVIDSAMDISGGESGNIICSSVISGTVTSGGEIVE